MSIRCNLQCVLGLPWWLRGSACNARDPGSVPGLGRSGEGNGNPLQYSCLENPMDGGAWRATVRGVAKTRTWLNDFTFTMCFASCLLLLHVFGIFFFPFWMPQICLFFTYVFSSKILIIQINTTFWSMWQTYNSKMKNGMFS